MGAHYEVRTDHYDGTDLLTSGFLTHPLGGKARLLPELKKEYYRGFYYKDEAVAFAEKLRSAGYQAETFSIASGKQIPR